MPSSRRRPAFPVLTALLMGAAVAAPAAEPAPKLRELSTDRPDATESPFTVDAGHVQLEMDAATYTRNRLDGVRTTEFQFAPLNLRYGVTPDAEVGIFLTPHVEATERVRGGAKTRVRGIGDTTLRAKFNLWGNEGGPSAFGVMVDVKVPTAANGLGNDKVESALTLPYAFELGAGWEGAAMTSFENAITGRGRRGVWVNTITFGHDLAENLGGFVELTSSAGDGAHVATFNFGVTRKLSARTQLDAGAYVGISRTAPDLTVFLGLARKF